MKFLFWLANHNLTGQRSLEDVIGIIGHQLRALGHEAVWVKANDKFLGRDNGINIIVEGFTPLSVREITKYHEMGARFLMIATEEPTPKGFNYGLPREMVDRQKIFPEVGKICEGIIHLVPGDHVTKWYSQFAPSAQAELGYAPTLVRSAATDTEPDHDFGFYGSLSERRVKLIKRLANRCNKVNAIRVVGDFQEQNDRDREMRRCKVIIQIRKFKEMGLVSSSRCCTALCLGRPVIAEPHQLSHPWDEVIPFAQTEEGFLNRAMMMLTYWRGAHADQFAKFKARFTPEVCIGRALDQIGILKERVAA